LPLLQQKKFEKKKKKRKKKKVVCCFLLRNFCLESSYSVFSFWLNFASWREKENPRESNKGFFGNLFKGNRHILKRKS
jgi:hypothetical protein